MQGQNGQAQGGVRYITEDMIRKVCKEDSLEMVTTLNLQLVRGEGGKKIKVCNRKNYCSGCCFINNPGCTHFLSRYVILVAVSLEVIEMISHLGRYTLVCRQMVEAYSHTCVHSVGKIVKKRHPFVNYSGEISVPGHL